MDKEKILREAEIKEAVWQERKKGISAVWIVPIVALLIGGWLFFKSWSEKGPEIEIVFKSAAGIQADKTVIKYKDIVVGKVTDVRFGNALKTVRVKAQLQKNMKPYLSENTRFWVVQAKVGFGEVQGLDTLLSGVYIEMDPQKGKKKVRLFEGLDKIPVVSTGEKGKTYLLEADSIGSIDVGSPVYFKQIKAGSVASYRLDFKHKKVMIEVFIKEPFDTLINDKTRFYNASGIQANISPDGIKIRTESLVALLMGGLAFENFPIHGIGKPVKSGHLFALYPSRDEAKKPEYKRELYFWVYFDGSIRGLTEGSSVEFRGLKIGEVVNFNLIGDTDTGEFKIPILLKIEPERFTITGSKKAVGNRVNEEVFLALLRKGLRAELKTGNLLTGERYVDLEFHTDAPPIEPRKEFGYFVIPSIPGTIETLKSSVQKIVARIEKIPFEQIGMELEGVMKDLRTKTMPSVDASMHSLQRLLTETSQMLRTVRKNFIDNNAIINKKMLNLIEEMTRTTKSVKHLTDYLERHPESLIKGK